MTIHESISMKASCFKDDCFEFTLMDVSALCRGRESQANTYRKGAQKLAGVLAQLHWVDIDVEHVRGEKVHHFMFACYGDCRAEMNKFEGNDGFTFVGEAEFIEDEFFTFRYLAAAV